jgi:hypothetical protein
MQAITTIGLDIAKSVDQIHGIDAEGQVVIRRRLKRRNVLAFFQKLPSGANERANMPQVKDRPFILFSASFLSGARDGEFRNRLSIDRRDFCAGKGGAAVLPAVVVAGGS